MLNNNGVVIDAPRVDCLLRNVYTLDTGDCVCGLDSIRGWQYCLRCSHSCEGICKDYTTYSTEYCTSKAQFYFWLQNCSCMCTVSNCHHCEGCQSCCQCSDASITCELLKGYIHLICQDTTCSNIYLLSLKCVANDQRIRPKGTNQNFPSKRFASQVIGFFSTRCEASWMLLYQHISMLLVKSSKPNWNRLQRDVKGYILDIHLKYLSHDQMIRGLTPQCDSTLCSGCRKDLDWLTSRGQVLRANEILSLASSRFLALAQILSI